MNKNIFCLLLLAMTALISGFFAQYLSSNEAVKTNSPMLEFSLPDMTGQQQHISQWQNKIRIINFWATWCPPCLKEIPEFIQLQNQFNDQNIQFIGIAIDNKQSVINYLATIPINYPILMAEYEGASLAQQLGNNFRILPFTLIINQQGQIIHRQHGEISRAQILAIIKPNIKSAIQLKIS